MQFLRSLPSLETDQLLPLSLPSAQNLGIGRSYLGLHHPVTQCHEAGDSAEWSLSLSSDLGNVTSPEVTCTQETLPAES